MYFNWAKWDYAEKYNLNKDEIHEENVMLEIGEYGDERITLYKFNADSTFLADTFIYEKQISNPIIFVIYEGKSSEKAYEAYDNQQLTII